ncbi:hypothetical protein ACHQM5_028284 [Ranunculus cassubicifolius]
MASKSHFLVPLLLIFTIFSHQTLAKCHVDDETGLLAFKSGITQDPTGILSSWKPGTDCCTWSGVECRENNRVTSLSVYGKENDPKSYLSGTISPSLSKVQNLDGIYFQFLKNITGSFPTFVFLLPKLQYVYIQNSKLSGPIPVNIGQKLSKLGALGLSDNRFSGSIPASVSQLTELTQLVLGGNALTGPIPDGIRNLKNLTYLNLEKNQLSGKIPDFFGSFSDLRTLSLSYNKLSGEIPASISALASKLRYLELGNNALTGKIPNYIGTFKELDTLDLSSNQLTGLVPSTLKNLTKIFNLNLARNQLLDPFPQLNVRGIESLDLSYNKFKLGILPKWVQTSPIIYSLKLAGCGLKFRLEDFKPSETYYYDFIDLSDNQISGSPVSLLNQTTLLKEFRASNNLLRFNMSDLVIPSTLKYLDLSRNQVFGKIPKNISGLQTADLSQNHLCGQIPPTKLPASAFQGNDCLCGTPLPACKK